MVKNLRGGAWITAPFFKLETVMPKATVARKSAKNKAKKVAKAKKYVAKAEKIGAKSVSKQLSPKRKTQIKGMAKAATAENLQRAGRKVVKSGGQGSLPKKASLKVTPKSMHKKATAGDKYYTGKKKAYKGSKK
jgi:hypothetical protein